MSENKDTNSTPAGNVPEIILFDVTLPPMGNSGMRRHQAVSLQDGKVAGVIGEYSDISELRNFFPQTRLIDCKGMTLLPSLADYHVHFRQPGFEYKETIRGGSEAAAAGGYTAVCTMPNLNPAPDSPENLKVQTDIIDSDAVIDVFPYATITLQRKGNECVDFAAILDDAHSRGYRLAGFSDDGSGIQEAAPMREALKASAELGFTVAAHCEVNDLLRGGYIHDGEYCAAHGYKGICSESEWKEVERDIRLAEETGGRLHICHVSTKESVELVRQAKRRGVKVTCETGPHYLVLCDADLHDEGRFKMNPPLRGAEDRDALLRGVADGTVDIIATDHAPHSEDEKNRGLAKSAMGIVGLETAFPLLYTHLVMTGKLTLSELVELMSFRPKEIMGLEAERDYLKFGTPADLILVDTDTLRQVDPSRFHGHGTATPFAGDMLRGFVMMTIKEGRVVWEHPELKKGGDAGRKVFSVVSNERLTSKTFKMTLCGDTREFTRPGQFVNIEIPGRYLRRPISVADYTGDVAGTLTLLYDVVGKGTEMMSQLQKGDRVDLLTALGNGFDPDACGDRPILLGGGIGCAPMLGLARTLKEMGKRPVVALGFNSAADVVMEAECKEIGVDVYFATADGSLGLKGFVTDLYRDLAAQAVEKGEAPFDYFYACGPTPMLRAVCREIEIPGEVSLDERMACGFGICMCCSVRTRSGARRACADGPVFPKEEVIW